MKTSFQRLRECTMGGYVIHANAPGGNDYTLCGYAYEGSCVEGEGDSGVKEVARGKINCADCLGIIWHCREQIPKRVLAPLGRPIIRVKRDG